MLPSSGHHRNRQSHSGEYCDYCRLTRKKKKPARMLASGTLLGHWPAVVSICVCLAGNFLLLGTVSFKYLFGFGSASSSLSVSPIALKQPVRPFRRAKLQTTSCLYIESCCRVSSHTYPTYFGRFSPMQVVETRAIPSKRGSRLDLYKHKKRPVSWAFIAASRPLNTSRHVDEWSWLFEK